MKTHKIFSPAKINLFLEVLSKQPDGFHEIETVMLAVDLFDEISIKVEKEKSDESKITLECEFDNLDCTDFPCNDNNLVVKAAKLFLENADITAQLKIKLLKRIPWGSGLGGGSSNAASVLKALNIIFKSNLSNAYLAKIGAELGSDIPFFFYLPAAKCTGRGEIVTAFDICQQLNAVILFPEIFISTSEIYRNVKISLKKYDFSDKIVELLSSGECNKLSDLTNLFFNRLEEVALKIDNNLCRIFRETDNILDSSTKRLLTGSGSAVVFYTSDDKQKSLAAELQKLKLGRVFEVKTFLGKHRGERIES